MGKLEKLLLTLKSVPAERVSISLPRSKSISNRLLVMQALSGKNICIQYLSKAEDTRFLKDMLCTETVEKWVGEAGTALRFGLAWAAITPGKHILRGSQRISQRPIKGLIDALLTLGADIQYAEKEGFAPLLVNGKSLKGGSIDIQGQLSSQFVTALLLIAPYLEGGITLKLGTNQVSKPYVDMTVSLMKQAGAQISVEEEEIVVGEGGYQKTSFVVEPDWSAASYFYSFKYLIPSLDLEIEGLTNQSDQGDIGLVGLAEEIGLHTKYEGGKLHFEVDEAKVSGQLNFRETPDLAQTFAVMAAGKPIPLKLEGLETLRVKETDRIAALVSELKKCGVSCNSTEESLEILGFEEAKGIPEIETFQDHRMAMAFAPLVGVFGQIIISNPDVVGKSFPDFWAQVEKMGIEISRIYSESAP